MGRLSKEEKLEASKDLLVALAPYIWDRHWGYGVEVFFDDVHVDFREVSGYIFTEEDACDRDRVLEHFDIGCVEDGLSDDKQNQDYIAERDADDALEMFIECEEEIFEEIYLYMWEGIQTGKGIYDNIMDTLDNHNLACDIVGDVIHVFYADESA